MRPSRTEKVNGNKIEEFYWAGEFVIYVNNRLFDGDFETAINNCMNKEETK